MPDSYLANMAAVLTRAHQSMSIARTLPDGPPDAGPLPSWVQPLEPAIPWNWTTPGPGQLSLQQFNFCDTQPASCRPGVPFQTGSDSFSGAYETFIRLLDPAFEPASILEDALSALRPPEHTPGTGVDPRGNFVAVMNSAGVLQWKPDWQVAMRPDQWAKDQGSPLHLDLGMASGFIRESSHVHELDGKLRLKLVTASRAARVPVNAGSWYAYDLVRLGQSGPFIGSHTVEQILGPTGILQARITELFVAAELSASAIVQNDSDAQTLLGYLRETPTARMGCLAASDATFNVSRSAGAPCLTAEVAKPFIIAVSVRPVIPLK